jgi:pilus assembly protein CpaD
MPSFLRAAAPLLSVCLAAACAAPAPMTGPVALTPTEQFALEIRSTVDEILLAPTGGLSPNQQAALAEMADRWREAGEGPVVVHHAARGPAADTAQASAQALYAAGVPGPFLQMAPFEAAADAPAVPVRVGFSRLVAVGPRCADLWSDLTRTGDNGPHAGFGCATAANLAAQIANPRDLVAPRAGYPADAARRAHVIQAYRKGENTGSARSDDERGDVNVAR